MWCSKIHADIHTGTLFKQDFDRTDVETITITYALLRGFKHVIYYAIMMFTLSLLPFLLVLFLTPPDLKRLK